ncbi:MAG: hypothetical protein F4Y75_01405 [Acidimicrobiia bacterium]|nr:hypothetical protein [bacterium]MXX63902.1 hypothetical protein [Acidimicrobiia bacterium]MCY3579608.1 hypothetical protein [bacterium]MCY3652774.1 hypothetical protein [bacterium]MXZ06165.1 hypothetical protein [Acidimicrobiia bacterium]
MTTVKTTDLDPGRLAESARKIRPPFELDLSLCLYSPQDNLDSMQHPLVADFHHYIKHEWVPAPTPSGSRRVAILIPCTKFKPYSTSREHRAINQALLEAGWLPDGPSNAPDELKEVLDEGESTDLLHDGPLRRGKVYLDRFVLSEPLGMVPYPHIYFWRGNQSPATSYDDPGLFEARGTSVAPERSDCTAVPLGNGKWRWGPAERQAYAETHNILAGIIRESLVRLAPLYQAVGAWVSPGLTHRSFLADDEFRRKEGLARSRKGTDGPVRLVGVLEDAPGLVTMMPAQEQLEDARHRLAERLKSEGRNHTPAAVRGIYARGDGNDTPLGLPETLTHLTSWLDGL